MVKLFDIFKQFKVLVEKENVLYIKTLRTDRGEEFISHEFISFYEENMSQRKLTNPYTPMQNRVAKRKKCIVVDMAQSILKRKGLLNNLGAKPLATATQYFFFLSNVEYGSFEVWHNLHSL